MIVRSFTTFLGSLLITSFISGCTAFVSGGNPIPIKATDRNKIDQALKIFRDAPLISHQIDGRPVRIYKVAFDGTLNDRERVPLDDRQTIVARIANLIGADDYQTGAGMRGKDVEMWDAIKGDSSAKTAENAKENFFAQARNWLLEDSRMEIRLFVTGFSRGAATARHFMNIVSREWNDQFFKSDLLAMRNSSSPRIYTLLYDTVATGQHNRLELSLPRTVDYAVHFVAIDEPRTILFTPTIDVDADPLPTQAEFFGDSLAPPKRLNTLYLPGAHSDVGASYQEGIGDLYTVLTEQFLYMMGLTKTNCWDLRHDPFVNGKHDSRGTLDKLFGSRDPDTVKDVSRKPIPIYMAKLSPEEKGEAAKRLKEFWLANFNRMAGTYTSIKNTLIASVELRGSGLEFELVGASEEVKSKSVQLKRIDDFLQLDFVFAVGDAKAEVRLKPSVLKRIRPAGSVISLTYLETRGRFSLAFFVDGLLADLIPMEKGAEITFRRVRDNCLKQPDGSSRSPINMFLLHTDGTVSTPNDPDPK